MKLESHMSSTVGGLWENEMNNEGMIIGCKILAYFQLTKSVTIKISFKKGIFMVTGTNYRDWITSEFPLMDTEEALLGINEPNPKLLPPKEPLSAVHISSDVEADLIAVNENVEANKFAIGTLEHTILKLLQAISVRNEIDGEKAKRHQDDLLALQKKYDDKLTIYQQECEKTFTKRIQETEKNLNGKLSHLQIVTGKIKNSLQKQLDSLSTSISSTNHHTQTDIEMDTSGYLKGIETLCNDIKKHHEEIVELKKEHETAFFSTIGFKEQNTKQQQQLQQQLQQQQQQQQQLQQQLQHQ